jgi:hypothetical protein
VAFKKGQSGNPRGRPKGIVNQAKLRTLIAGDLPDIIKVLVEAAKEGDTTAAKVLMDKALGSMKPVDTPVSVPLSGSLSDAGAAVLKAVERQELTPDQGGKLLQSLGFHARLVETDELLKRIEALEARQ